MKRTFALVFLLLVLAQTRASELFVWISSPGTYEVTVGDQFQKSSKGKFRFFDLDSGTVAIKVKKQGTSGTFYEGRVRIQTGKCMVVEIGQNDLYHVSHVDCSGNYDIPSDDKGQLSSNNKNDSSKTDYSKYHGPDQGNNTNDSSKTDYSKYHGTDQGNKQNDSSKTDYSKYHGTDQGNGQNDLDKTDYSKYQNNTGTGQGNSQNNTAQGNSQNELNKIDYSKYQNNTGTGQGNTPNNSNKTDQGNTQNNTTQGNTQNSTGQANSQNNPNKTDYGKYHGTDQANSQNNTAQGNSQQGTGYGNNHNNWNNTGNSQQGTVYGNNHNWNNTGNSYPNNSNNTGNSNHNNSNNADYSNYNNNGCDENAFNEMFEILRAKPFDSQKLEQAKLFAPQAHYTSAQVKRICELMKFDSIKLEFAKFAYDYTADKDNYAVVNKVFRMDMFSKDLKRYVDSRR